MPVVLNFSAIDEICISSTAKLHITVRDCATPTFLWENWQGSGDPLGENKLSEGGAWAHYNLQQKLLAKFDTSKDYKRNKMQLAAHKCFTIASLKPIFGAEYPANANKLRRIHRFKVLKQETLVSAARRNGKTYAACEFSSATMCSIPHMTIAVFSTGRRASHAFLLTVAKMIVFLGYKEWVHEFNQEVITLRNPADHRDLRKLSSFPSRPEIGNVFYKV